MSTLDNFKKEAKRWLAAIRLGDAAARARLRTAYPAVPDPPALRHVQHALAREHGFDSSLALKTRHTANTDPGHSDRVARFLTFSCWDHHVHGKGDHRMYDRAAQRLLSQYQKIAHDSLYTAIVCGELQEVQRILAERPAAAREPSSARGWPPILYLCFTRFTHPQTTANAVEIARLLLDCGADPNAYYKAGDSNYTALVGVAGEGEQDSPRQPQAKAVFQLLL